MRLEWIEDILAVAETGSMIKAAERRCLTQSAFSRRIRMIEERLGTELFDRSRKPVELRAVVHDQRQEMLELATRLRRLASALRHQRQQTPKRIVIASQHTITTTIAPALVRKIGAAQDLDVRLRSANREECYALLLMRHADIMLFYSTDRHPLPMEKNFVELHILSSENLIPVFAASRLSELEAQLELEGIEPYRKTMALCEKHGDFVSRELIADILAEEEEHQDHNKTELDLIDRIDIENFGQSQV